MKDDILSLTGGKFAVGLSALVGITTLPYQNNLIVKYLSGGASGLYLGGASMAIGLDCGLSGYLGGGYQIAIGEIISLPMCGKPFFTAAGSTAIFTVLTGKTNSEGATTL